MSIYYLFYVIGFIAMTVYTLLLAPKYNIKRGRAIVHMTLSYVTNFLVMLLMYYIVNGGFGGQNIVRVYIFVPLIHYCYGRILNMPIAKTMDLTAPFPCILLGFAKFGCLIDGCCRSWLHVDWGMYNPIVNATLFPVQLFEGLTALFIVIMVWMIARDHNYNAQGRTMPIMLLLFGITRFGWEFLRDNTKLFWGLSEFSLWALASAIMGIIWLVWLDKKKVKKENEDLNHMAELKTN